MGCWKYCHKCGHGQNKITVEDLQAISYDAYKKVSCVSCGAERDDDYPEERMTVLLDEIVALKSRTAKITDILKRISRAVVMRSSNIVGRP